MSDPVVGQRVAMRSGAVDITSGRHFSGEKGIVTLVTESGVIGVALDGIGSIIVHGQFVRPLPGARPAAVVVTDIGASILSRRDTERVRVRKAR